MNFNNNKFLNKRASILAVALSVALLAILASCTSLDSGVTPITNGSNGSNGAANNVGASDQHRILNEFSNMPSAKALNSVTGDVEPDITLRPLFTGSSKVAMKLLIISANGNPTTRDSTDPTLDAITFFAENIGIPYDVMIASSEALTEAKLIDANGDGRYQAIILTDNGLSVAAGGTSTSAFDETEWNLLWQYAREFNVRQVSFNGVPGTFPEDLGLRLFDSISTTTTLAQNISLTTEGQSIFSSLKADAAIPVKNVIMNLTNYCGEDASIACPEGVTTTPVLRTAAENKVIAAVSNTTDGREVLSLMLGQNITSNHSAILSYDALKWATQGVFLGAREMYLQVDIDDWFQQSLVWDPATNTNSTQVFRVTGQDVLRAKAQLDSLKARFPVAANLNFSNAVVSFRGEGTAVSNCAETATLSEMSICLKDEFDWVSHTYTERAMNFESPGYNNAADIFYNAEAPELNGPLTGFTCDDTALTGLVPASIAEELAIKEVVCNANKMQQMGLPFDRQSVITSAHSGLGHYNPDPLNPVFIDNGLQNSSPGTLRGLEAAGIKYMASNYSVESHRGVCGSCGRNHPTFPNIFLVPRFPTLMFFNATNPVGIESQYNFLFGANSPNALPTATNLTYQEILKLDAEKTLQHIVSAQPYMHFFHQANLDNYTDANPGNSLVHDWIETFLTYYTSFYDLPLLSLSWAEQAANIEQRTSYFLSDTTGVWDRVTGEVVVTSTNGGAVYVTNANFAGATTSSYGTDVIQKFQLGAGQSLSGSTTDLPTPTNPTPTNPTPTNPTPTPTPISPIVPYNLLVNGSFENRRAAWSSCGTGATRIIQASSEGQTAIKLSGQRGACLYQEVAVVPGSDYALTCDVKRNNSARWSSLALKFNNANYTNEVDGELKEIMGSAYSPLSLSATAPANTDIAVVVLFSEDSASVDNCVLTGAVRTNPNRPTPAASNLLVNGDFENNLSGWTKCSSSNNSLVATDPDVVSGVHSLELDDKGCLYQDVVISGGETLRLSCFAKSASSEAYTSMGLSISSANYASELLTKEVEVLGQSFESVELSVTAPSSGAIASVALYSEDYANFDDCVLISQ